ncbi:unnamed protein product [Ilex paraguariensis]|uniref:Uncharacterized protein n=1 Tax=Ilex paraguariensis TaxID=185542 RepID=A0ABC8TWE8_9AQUA
MCSLVAMLGLSRSSHRESRRAKEFEFVSTSFDLSVRLKDITVRIIHAGGKEELYQNPIPASQLMRKYPGMCVARPQVFKNPHDSILMAEEKLLPGQKYYIIPSTTVQKLKSKRSQKVEEAKEPDVAKEAVLDHKEVGDRGGDVSEESVCSAKEFYVSKEKWSRCIQKKSQKGKQKFVPPIQKPRILRLDWEPSLTSVQELSP